MLAPQNLRLQALFRDCGPVRVQDLAGVPAAQCLAVAMADALTGRIGGHTN